MSPIVTSIFSLNNQLEVNNLSYFRT